MNFEVITTAVGGYTAAENLTNLTHRVLPLDSDLAIYDEGNTVGTSHARRTSATRCTSSTKAPRRWRIDSSGAFVRQTSCSPPLRGREPLTLAQRGSRR